MTFSRHRPMRRCGKPYATRAAALSSPAGRRQDTYVPGDSCSCGGFHVRKKTLQPVPSAASVKAGAPRPARRAGAATGIAKPAPGFSRKTKLTIRTRAGDGDPDRARCEFCRKFLGRYGGQCQHIIARGMGGTTDEVRNSAANGALLCGTSVSGCHGRCEKRDEDMEAAGFWHRGGADPRVLPMMLHGTREVWRSADGTYLDAMPDLAVAA